MADRESTGQPDDSDRALLDTGGPPTSYGASMTATMNPARAAGDPPDGPIAVWHAAQRPENAPEVIRAERHAASDVYRRLFTAYVRFTGLPSRCLEILVTEDVARGRWKESERRVILSPDMDRDVVRFLTSPRPSDAEAQAFVIAAKVLLHEFGHAAVGTDSGPHVDGVSRRIVEEALVDILAVRSAPTVLAEVDPPGLDRLPVETPTTAYAASRIAIAALVQSLARDMDVSFDDEVVRCVADGWENGMLLRGLARRLRDHWAVKDGLRASVEALVCRVVDRAFQPMVPRWIKGQADARTADLALACAHDAVQVMGLVRRWYQSTDATVGPALEDAQRSVLTWADEAGDGAAHLAREVLQRANLAPTMRRRRD